MVSVKRGLIIWWGDLPNSTATRTNSGAVLRFSLPLNISPVALNRFNTQGKFRSHLSAGRQTRADLGARQPAARAREHLSHISDDQSPASNPDESGDRL